MSPRVLCCICLCPLLISLGGCGNKGPLFLPEEQLPTPELEPTPGDGDITENFVDSDAENTPDQSDSDSTDDTTDDSADDDESDTDEENEDNEVTPALARPDSGKSIQR